MQLTFSKIIPSPMLETINLKNYVVGNDLVKCTVP